MEECKVVSNKFLASIVSNRPKTSVKRLNLSPVQKKMLRDTKSRSGLLLTILANEIKTDMNDINSGSMNTFFKAKPKIGSHKRNLSMHPHYK